MKVLVTGAKGQLGSDVIKELDKRNHISVGADIDEMYAARVNLKVDLQLRSF